MTIVAPTRPAVNPARVQNPANTTAAPSPSLNVPANLWAGICARAPFLFLDGRRIEPVKPGLFRIVCPDAATYTPHMLEVRGEGRYVCTCKCYRQWKGCKHGLGLACLIAAQLEDYDARLRQLPVLQLDGYTRSLLHRGANPHLVCPASEALQIEYADALDQARWDLHAAWEHTKNPACELYLCDTLRAFVPEGGAK